MRKTVYALMALVLVAAFVSCVPYEKKLKDQGARLLSHSELVEIFSHDRAVTFSTKSGSADGYYYPDGTQKIIWPGGGDQGTYKIENGQICSRWNHTRGGKEECFNIYHTPENKYVWIKPDGSYDSRMIIKK